MNIHRNGEFTLYLKTAILLLGGLVERASFLHKAPLLYQRNSQHKTGFCFPLPLLLETYRPQLRGIPLQILGNVKHLVDNTIHFLENIKRREPLKMCLHEQDSKPNPVGRWAGQRVRSSRVTYWPFLRSSPLVSALYFSPNYKALWRVDTHKKHRT